MSWSLEFLPEALCELEEATRYYQSCDAELGVRFRHLVEDACGAISTAALLWNERRGGHRRVNLRGFPYYIAYIVRGERIVVAAVAHARRHPDYWKRRSLGGG